MKNKRTTDKRRVVASVLSLLMVMQQSAAYQALAATITNTSGVPLKSDNGVFNITPDMVNQAAKTGFRKFGQFKLERGEIANFIFKMYNRSLSDDGQGNISERVDTHDIDTFIAAVNSGKVDINGIVNALNALPNGATGTGTEAGSFKPDSHLVFVAPGGVVVGSSGVLNVGSFSAVTPTQSAYDAFAANITEAEMFTPRDEATLVTFDGTKPDGTTTTTYHREAYIYRNLEMLQKSLFFDKNCKEYYGRLHIFIIDNAQELQLKENAYTHLVYNENSKKSSAI